MSVLASIVSGGGERFRRLEVGFAKLALGKGTRLRLYEQLGTMVENKLTPIQALDNLHQRAVRRGGVRSPEAIALDAWRKALRNGRQLEVALEGWSPDDERGLIAAGARAGKLQVGIAAVMRSEEAMKEIRGAILGGTLYPLMLIHSAAGVLVYFSFKIIPSFALILPVSKWEGQALMLARTSNFISSWGLFVAGGFYALLFLVLWSMPRLRGRTRIRLDRIPPWNLYRLIKGMGFLMSVAAMNDAGVAVAGTLRHQITTANPYLRERLEATLRMTVQGANLGQALAATGYEFPDREVIDDLEVYASYRGFGQALRTVSDVWIAKGIRAVQIQARILNTLGLLIMAGVAGWLISGIYAIQSQVTTAAMRGGL